MYRWYAAVAIAILAMSWGGPIFVLLSETPFAAVFWRMSCTVLMMVPGLIADLRKEKKDVITRWKASWPGLFVTGIVLGLHFVAFSCALSRTSFSSAMLLVATTPMILVVWTSTVFLAYKLLMWKQGSLFSGGSKASVALSSVDQLKSAGTEDWGQLYSTNAPLSESPADFVTANALPSATPSMTTPPTTTTIASSDAINEFQIEAAVVTPTSPSFGDPVVAAGATLSSPQNPKTFEITQQKIEIDATTQQSDTSKQQGASTQPDATALQRVLLACAYQKNEAGHPAKPTKYEALGSIIAFSAICVLILGRDESATSKERAQTVGGDLLALSAASGYVMTLVIGATYRKWMPLWLFSFPVFFAATIAAGVCTWVMEDPPFVGYFAWLTDARLFGLTLAIAFIPGILGHTLANLALRRINPLVLSVSLLTQPLISGVYGYILGIQNVPGISTLLAAPILLGGIALVVIGSPNGLKTLRQMKVCRRLTPAASPQAPAANV